VTGTFPYFRGRHLSDTDEFKSCTASGKISKTQAQTTGPSRSNVRISTSASRVPWKCPPTCGVSSGEPCAIQDVSQTPSLIPGQGIDKSLVKLYGDGLMANHESTTLGYAFLGVFIGRMWQENYCDCATFGPNITPELSVASKTVVPGSHNQQTSTVLSLLFRRGSSCTTASDEGYLRQTGHTDHKILTAADTLCRQLKM
jgi:hypothetical protein